MVGQFLLLQSVTPDREAWTALVRRQGDRAIGRLYRKHDIIRKNFDVRIDTFDCFQVDIGTGSGVKVKFHFGSNLIPSAKWSPKMMSDAMEMVNPEAIAAARKVVRRRLGPVILSRILRGK
jgi:hypothetical protein